MQISEAKKRLQVLLGEQRKTNQEIQDLRDLIRANANLLPENERTAELLLLEFLKFPANVGEAVRLALFVATSTSGRVTPVQIKDMAGALGFDFSEYSNPMASIHSILKRMRESTPPEVEYDEKDDSYRFASFPPDIVNQDFLNSTIQQVLASLVCGGDPLNIEEKAKKAALQSVTSKAEAIKTRGT